MGPKEWRGMLEGGALVMGQRMAMRNQSSASTQVNHFGRSWGRGGEPKRSHSECLAATLRARRSASVTYSLEIA